MDTHAAARITAELTTWPGVTTAEHERGGGVEFRYGRRELGHLHGDRIADLPLPRRLRDELVAAGRANPHHVLPDSGWITKPMRSTEDVTEAIALFELAYERAVAQAERRR